MIEENDLLFYINPNISEQQELPLNLGYIRKENKYYWIKNEEEVLPILDIQSFFKQIIESYYNCPFEKYFLIKYCGNFPDCWIFSKISSSLENFCINFSRDENSLTIIKDDYFGYGILRGLPGNKEDLNFGIQPSDIIYMVEIKNLEKIKEQTINQRKEMKELLLKKTQYLSELL